MRHGRDVLAQVLEDVPPHCEASPHRVSVFGENLRVSQPDHDQFKERIVPAAVVEPLGDP